MAPINVALLGAGIFIKEEHVPAVLATPLLTLKAVYSRSLKSAQATAELVPASNGPVDLYSTDSGAGKELKDLLARDDIKGVIIALPIRDQPEFIKLALEAGKHVLAEKPLGPDLESAEKFLAWYKQISREKNVTWAVAENFRYKPSFVFAAGEVKKLGRILGFNFKIFSLTAQGGKYFETSWRKVPTHNYGFILDGGVHSAAAVRLLLGDEIAQTTVGYSSLAREHLPPVDTLSAVIKTIHGAVGSFNISFGTIARESNYTIHAENGSVALERDKVIVYHADGSKEERDFPYTSGVTEEVQAWATALAEGKPQLQQTPEEALADLELLELMLKSGDENGAPKTLKLQTLPKTLGFEVSTVTSP